MAIEVKINGVDISGVEAPHGELPWYSGAVKVSVTLLDEARTHVVLPLPFYNASSLNHGVLQPLKLVAEWGSDIHTDARREHSLHRAQELSALGA